ncbi:MAG: DNA primase [Bacteroidales bacterium]|nr:DNA primase [Bacteroidales bacterium]
MIPQETIQRIFDTMDVVDVVSDFVKLKRAGTVYKGLCPFHHEKTPSFVVSPAKGIFKCFGCGKGGSPVNFVMEHEHLSYPEALKFLAKKYNIEFEDRELSAQEIAQKNQRESMMVLSQFAQKWFSEQLLHTNEGKSIGGAYFKERGFRGDIIEKFQLGYSPEARDAFSKHAQSKGYHLDYLVATGLTIKGEHNQYDRFHGRVLFPIHNLTGNTIGFGGRIMRNDKKIAKYLNSIDSEIYHKSDILYGIFQAKKAINQQDKCFLVEGYTDVLSMHQAGIENVVASSGTSLTTNQIRLIARFTQNLTVLYDGDAAGIKASLRGIDMILTEGLNVKVVLLPDGEDPDSFAQKLSVEEFMNFIESSQKDFIQFKAKLLMDETKSDPIKKAQAISSIVHSVALIPDSITRSVFIRELAQSINVPEQTLYAEVGKKIAAKLNANSKSQYARTGAQQAVEQKKLSIKGSSLEEYEKVVIHFLLNYGHEIMFTHLDNEEFGLELTEEKTIKVAKYIFSFINAEDELQPTNDLYYKIYEEYWKNCDNEKYQPQKHFVNHSNPQISQLSADLLSDSYELSKIWNKGDRIVNLDKIDLKINIPKTLWEYKYKKIQSLMQAINKEMALTKEAKAVDELIHRLMRLKDVNILIAKELGERIIM